MNIKKTLSTVLKNTTASITAKNTVSYVTCGVEVIPKSLKKVR